MMPIWASLNESDRAIFRAIIAFLNNRLEEKSTIDWALKLRPTDNIKRLAIRHQINNPNALKVKEPWRSAWRLIEESWDNEIDEDRSSSTEYDLHQRLLAGDRSGSLVTAITRLVSPRLEIKAFSKLHLSYQQFAKKPKNAADLFSIEIKSSENFDPSLLMITNLTDEDFLLSLANSLDTTVTNGLDIAMRVGFNNDRSHWRRGDPNRVYFVPVTERANGDNEPDEFRHGIAPSVKLLHEVIKRLVDINISIAQKFIKRWKITNSPIHLRLWAALSRDPKVTSTDEVASMLTSIDNRLFWNINLYPEIAELRSKRFNELNLNEQVLITARIRKYPPRNLWPSSDKSERVAEARLYWAIRELRRIEIAGGTLPKRDKIWLNNNINLVPELSEMNQLEHGFPTSPKAQWVSATPDNKYDMLAGEYRLNALEVALSQKRGGWDDDPSKNAADWIRQIGNPAKILSDFEQTTNGGGNYPRIWENFGWAFAPNKDHDTNILEQTVDGARTLALLIKLPLETITQAIDGISHWFSSWENIVVLLPEAFTVWNKVWPIAVLATNNQQPIEEGTNLERVVRSSDELKSLDLDTLNTPAGKLIGVFLAACSKRKDPNNEAGVDEATKEIRDIVIATNGRSGLIAQHRMIEILPFFLKLNPDWAKTNLITPLIAKNEQALTLWRAIARQIHFFDVLKIIGESMVERAADKRLGRDTRQSLVLSLIVECLNSFHENRKPAVPYSHIQQMLRLVDDEIRAYGAGVIQRYIHDVSSIKNTDDTTISPEFLFKSAATPFLTNVWPQEHSLATPGVSRALADLPATSGNAFSEAVNAIERFLVPFDCWSMIDYGLYGETNGVQNILIINTPGKAEAFLRLLDRTIGKAENSVIPHDLADALNQILKVAPKLSDNQQLRRLATAARRT